MWWSRAKQTFVKNKLIRVLLKHCFKLSRLMYLALKDFYSPILSIFSISLRKLHAIIFKLWIEVSQNSTYCYSNDVSLLNIRQPCVSNKSFFNDQNVSLSMRLMFLTANLRCQADFAYQIYASMRVKLVNSKYATFWIFKYFSVVISPVCNNPKETLKELLFKTELPL